MELFSIILLSFVQGVTEFFPISSSAHLFYVKKILGLFILVNYIDLFLHIGTLLSILIFFWKDFLIFLSFFLNFFKLTTKFGYIYQFNNCRNFNFFVSIIVSTLSSSLIAIPFKIMSTNIIFSERLVSYMLLISGTVLILTKLMDNKLNFVYKLSLVDSILIGFIQGLSIIPGISRLGMTLSYSIIIGLDYSYSLKYSFFLSVPTILGMFFFEIFSFNLKIFLFDLSIIFFGIFISFLVGFFSLKCFFCFSKRIIYLFGFYCYLFSLIIFFSF